MILLISITISVSIIAFQKLNEYSNIDIVPQGNAPGPVHSDCFGTVKVVGFRMMFTPHNFNRHQVCGGYTCTLNEPHEGHMYN